MSAKCYVDSFSAVDLSLPRKRNRQLTYAEFRGRVLAAGRFSAFEATATDRAARMFTDLCADPEIETDISCGFPWTIVRLRKNDVR